MIRNLTVFALSCLISASALAKPLVDPLLRPLLNSTQESDKVVKAILVFKNAKPKLSLPRSSFFHNEGAAYMKENARLSQAATLNRLRQMNLTDSQVKAESLWFVNGLIVELRASQLNALLADEAITKVYANRKLEIIKPHFH